MKSPRAVPIFLAALAILFVGLACGSDTSDQEGVRELAEDTQVAPSQDDDAGQSQEPTEVPPTDTPAPTPTEEIEGLVEEGTHLVGTDIEPGIFVGLAGEGLIESCYWARLDGLSGELDDLIANDNGEGLFYVEILETDTALETRCELLPIEQVPARETYLTELTSGTYLVGRDIEAGIFRGEAGADIVESCYWARLNNVNGGLGSIITNNNSTGQFFIEVQPTDFALTVRCEVTRVE